MPTRAQIDSILAFVGMDKVSLQGDTLVKRDPRVMLDFSSIAKGMACDEIGRNNTEVKMPAISKALYILFLFHEEGIPLNCLSDYKAELYRIYRPISTYGDDELLRRAIENLTDFVGNTLNATLSRIKKAFTDILGDAAASYLIQGKKGGRKIIHLDRNLVVFEDRQAFEV